MALKKCKECGEKVSTKAKECPNCGVKDPTTTASDKAIGCLVTLLIIIGAMIWLFSGDGDVLSDADGFTTLNLNVRNGPSSSYSIITTLEKGEQVEFVKDSAGWKYIRLLERDDKITGWASAQYLSDISEYSSFQDAQEKETQQTFWKEEVDKIGAYVMIQEFVEKRLVSPSSAEFPDALDGFDHDKNIDYLGDQTYVIRSYVDSENAFGASLRTQFTGKIKQTSKDKWQLLELNLKE